MRAEEKVGFYHSSFFDTDFEIEADYTSSNVLSVYIQVRGQYSSDKTFINVEGEDINRFITALKLAKEKYLEWTKVATTNNVKDMRKSFDIVFPRVTIAWYGSQWWFCFRHKLDPEFVVTSSGKCVFVMTDNVKSSRNEYIDTDYYLALSKASDFDELIEALDPEKIAKHFSKKQDVDNLFK